MYLAHPKCISLAANWYHDLKKLGVSCHNYPRLPFRASGPLVHRIVLPGLVEEKNWSCWLTAGECLFVMWDGLVGHAGASALLWVWYFGWWACANLEEVSFLPRLTNRTCWLQAGRAACPDFHFGHPASFPSTSFPAFPMPPSNLFD